MPLHVGLSSFRSNRTFYAGSTSAWKNVEHVDVGAREEETRGYRTGEARGAELPPRVTMGT